MRNFTILFFTIILLTSCSRNKYLTSDYEEYGRSHKTIAVLPYDILMKGRKVAEMDPAEVDRLRAIEAKLFQQSLYAEVLERTGRDNNDIQISVQSINKTNRLLKDAGIDVLTISEHSPNELGTILGVDAVISTKIVKELFLSREESLLVNVAGDVILNRVPVRLGTYNRNKLTRTSEIDIFCTIYDSKSESAVWALDTDCDLQWNNDPDEAIERINARISKKFPYRG